MTENTETGLGNHIGTLGETSLHADLKHLYARPGDTLEALVDGYVIDILRAEELVEVQTGNFYAIKRKLLRLLDDHPICLVFPIARYKWIVKQAADGSTSRRKSPRHGRIEHLFLELVRIPRLMAHPNFCLEVILINEEVVHVEDGKGSWRRKGWSITDHRLLEVVEQVRFRSPDDFRSFLPPGLDQPFTTRNLARELKQPRYLAQKMAYCLKEMGVIAQVGKHGRSNLYIEVKNEGQ